MAALVFDDLGPVGWQARYAGRGATGTGRSNAYFVASLNGGLP